MRMPEQLVAMVKRWEGFSPVPYICPAGYWTIGYGQLCDKDHPAITKEEGEALLRHSLRSYVAAALEASPILHTESDERLTAIADFVYNLGPTRYRSSTLRRRVNQGNWEAAQHEIKRWVYGGGRKLPGLVARRAAEAELLD